jgi:hypothetical protein
MGHRLLRNLVDFASHSWSTLSMPSILNGDKMLSSILKNHCNTTYLVLLSTVQDPDPVIQVRKLAFLLN